MGTTALVTIPFVGLFAFLLYRRLKLTFGRQQLAPRRMIARSVLLCVVGLGLLATLPTLAGFLSAAGGAVTGSLLGALGVQHTRFEPRTRGSSEIFYTPNKWLGFGVTALFLGRLGARLFTVYRILEETPEGALPSSEIHRSPFTLALYFLFAAYYVGLYAGLLGRARAEPATAATSTRVP